MAKPLARHTVRRMLDTCSAQLLHPSAFTSSAATNFSLNSSFQGTQQSVYPVDSSFTCVIQHGPALFPKQKFSTNVEKREKKIHPGTEKKPENPRNHKSPKNTRSPKIFESKFSEPIKIPQKNEFKFSLSEKIPKESESKFAELGKRPKEKESKFSESIKISRVSNNPKNGESEFTECEKIPKNPESDLLESGKNSRKHKIPGNPDSNLSDSEKLCSILNGDVALDDLVEKLEETSIEMNPRLLDEVIRKSDNAGRKALEFYKWAVRQPRCTPTLDNFNVTIDYFGRRNDFKAVDSLLKENRKGLKVDLKTFEIIVKRLVKAGREKKTVNFFLKMGECGFKEDETAQKIVVRELCDAGFASYAEKLVKQKADVYYPDEEMCNMLVKGWCVAGKLDEARRMVNEMSIGRLGMNAMAYNALLDCVCRLCIVKDPFRLMAEAKKILLEMEEAEVPRNEETFNVLIAHLCDIRQTSDAMNLFEEMEGYGCSPNFKTYFVLIRSLFLAARVAEGHEMLEKMKEAGFKAGERDYFEFIKVLCNIHRVEHAHKVFLTMKGNDCLPGSATYKLLIRKLCVAGHPDKGKKLFDEAVERNLILSNSTDLLVQSKVEKPAQEKKKISKKLTLAMKKKKRNLKLKKIRLSFVKKPRKPKMM